MDDWLGVAGLVVAGISAAASTFQAYFAARGTQKPRGVSARRTPSSKKNLTWGTVT